jgi:hypothetical protein
MNKLFAAFFTMQNLLMLFILVITINFLIQVHKIVSESLNNLTWSGPTRQMTTQRLHLIIIILTSLLIVLSIMLYFDTMSLFLGNKIKIIQIINAVILSALFIIGIVANQILKNNTTTNMINIIKVFTNILFHKDTKGYLMTNLEYKNDIRVINRYIELLIINY